MTQLRRHRWGMRISLILATLASASIITSCSRSSITAQESPIREPTFTAGSCPWESPAANTRCGAVEVDENRLLASKKRLNIAVAVFPANSETPAPDPVVFLCGGPGSQCLQPHWSRSPLREDRDLVVIETRGVGTSAQTPLCPELPERRVAALTANLDGPSEVALRVEDSLRCIRSLEASNVDLAAYNSAEAAADISEVMRALRYQEYNLWGLSYGSRIAQTVVRDHPKGVRSIVLDGPVPLDQVSRQTSWFVRSLRELSAACAAQPACAQQSPSLEADFYALVRDYNERPLNLELPATSDRPAQLATINGQDLVAFVQRSMYNTSSYPMLPLYIQVAKARNAKLIAPVLAQALGAYSGRSQGLRLLMNGFENSPFQTLRAYQEDAGKHPLLTSPLVLTKSDAVFYERWRERGLPTVGPEDFAPVHTNLPVLILGGAWDPITPPENAQALLPHLPNGISFTIPYAGHGMIDRPCGMAIGLAFLKNPSSANDAARCITALKPPRFHVAP